MNTKLIMTSSAITLGILGLSLTFAPKEVLALIDYGSAKSITLIFQLLGALYFAFAMINWNARASIIGGIYNKPIALGNFAHYLIGGFALIKFVFENQYESLMIWILCGIYVIFGCLFGIINFTHPLKEK